MATFLSEQSPKASRRTRRTHGRNPNLSRIDNSYTQRHHVYIQPIHTDFPCATPPSTCVPIQNNAT
jgi:hypothetical protein